MQKAVTFNRHFIVTSDANTIQTAEDAFNYARDILKTTFPEGEALIATDVHYSYCYAAGILKAPFPLGEAVISTDAEYSYSYALNILKAAFPEGEAAISKSSYYSYIYARYVLKAPYLEGEAAIAKDAHYFKKYKELFPEPQVVAPEPTKISNPISNLISEEVITETFAALKAANIEEVTVSFSDDSDGCQPVDWIKFCFNKQGIEDLIKTKRVEKLHRFEKTLTLMIQIGILKFMNIILKKQTYQI